jgi:hypothetical protein
LETKNSNGNQEGERRSVLRVVAVTNPAPGEMLPDGTVYAGISPDSGGPMCTTSADSGAPSMDVEAAKRASQGAAHGFRDWRVPTLRELNLLFIHREAIGGFDLSGLYPSGWYWSCSPSRNGLFAVHFSDGVVYGGCKLEGASLRCVRG